MSQPTTSPVVDNPQVSSRRRAVAFVDGQNLFHESQRLFGYNYPNYDIVKLCRVVCDGQGWDVGGIRFYTGVPSMSQNSDYKGFWDNKLFAMKHSPAKVDTFPRTLKTRDVSIRLYGGVTVKLMSTARGECVDAPTDAPWVNNRGRCLDSGTIVNQPIFTEKGIDVSLAVDAIKFSLESRYDVCLFFSQDADLEPAVKEIYEIGKSREPQFIVASAFPSTGSGYGIPSTRSIRIDKTTYDACIDPKNYFPKRRHPGT